MMTLNRQLCLEIGQQNGIFSSYNGCAPVQNTMYHENSFMDDKENKWTGNVAQWRLRFWTEHVLERIYSPLGEIEIMSRHISWNKQRRNKAKTAKVKQHHSQFLAHSIWIIAWIVTIKHLLYNPVHTTINCFVKTVWLLGHQLRSLFCFRISLSFHTRWLTHPFCSLRAFSAAESPGQMIWTWVLWLLFVFLRVMKTEGSKG